MEHGALAVVKQTFDLREFVQETLKLFVNDAARRKIELRSHVTPECPPQVFTDPRRLRQVVINLVSNALKFTHADGLVTMRVDLWPAHSSLSDKVRSFVEDEQQQGEQMLLHMEVADSGTGISADLLPKLFQPFTQGDSSLSRRNGGTGLGLAIARQLVELLGGRIWVETEEDRGTKFHFTFTSPKTGGSAAAECEEGPVCESLADAATPLTIASEMTAKMANCKPAEAQTATAPITVLGTKPLLFTCLCLAFINSLL
jgi:signal transduction histidine kinase